MNAPATYPAKLFHARTRREWKAIAPIEILSTYLKGPRLQFDPEAFAASSGKTGWHPELALDELRALRVAYWSTKDVQLAARLEQRARQLWAELVERSIGFAWPGGELVAWPP